VWVSLGLDLCCWSDWRRMAPPNVTSYSKQRERVFDGISIFICGNFEKCIFWWAVAAASSPQQHHHSYYPLPVIWIRPDGSRHGWKIRASIYFAVGRRARICPNM
jgi:hypothetical protein